MKSRFSLNRFLHNDKLVFIASIVIAVIVWALVVYGLGPNEERVIHGVPINIITNEQMENLRMTEGADLTATVTVSGTRSVIGRLSAKDISITADATKISEAGTYSLRLLKSTTYDYLITRVVSEKGDNDAVEVTFVLWDEQPKKVVPVLESLSVKDEKLMINTAAATPSGTAILSGNKVLVSGPREDVAKVEYVAAAVTEKKVLTTTTVLEAELIAYDKNNKPIKTVTFPDAEDGMVSVTVPVLMHHTAEIEPVLKNMPAGYDAKALARVNPTSIEFWSEADQKDSFLAKLQEKFTVDFDQLTPDQLTQVIVIEAEDGVLLADTPMSVELKLNMNNIKGRKVSIPLTKENVVLNADLEGFVCEINQMRITDVQLYGPSNLLSKIDPEKIKVMVDLSSVNTNVKNQVVTARLTLPDDNCWVCYGENKESVEVQIRITAKEE